MHSGDVPQRVRVLRRCGVAGVSLPMRRFEALPARETLEHAQRWRPEPGSARRQAKGGRSARAKKEGVRGGTLGFPTLMV
jgi:hypothetical protein